MGMHKIGNQAQHDPPYAVTKNDQQVHEIIIDELGQDDQPK